jgi:hypothetical protein
MRIASARSLIQMPTCLHSPPDKRAFGKVVGDRLLKRRGKRKSYSVMDITEAVLDAGFSVDHSCWAYALYTSREEFEAHHAATGEVCDYAVMKSEMFAAMTDGASSSWFDLDMSWLEWPDIDFSAIFNGFDF